MSQAGKFWKEVKKQSASVNPDMVQVAQVVSKEPLLLSFNGIEIGAPQGDNIWINELLLDDNINLDLASMESPQNLGSMTPPPWINALTPNSEYTALISGTQKEFLTDFYNWTKAVHQRYIISIGDYLAVQRLGNNTYLILEKVQKA